MAATEIFPYALWQAGTNQNSLPANDNSLRTEVVERAASGVANSAPATPAEGEIQIVGTPWGGFSTDEVVIFKSGTWLAFAPFDGWIKRNNESGEVLAYVEGDGWNVFASGGGGGGGLTWNQQTASYTLDLTDANNGVAMNVATANTLTVPPNSSQAIPVGASILIEQEGAGLTTVAAGAGVTIRKRGGSLALGGQYALATLVKRGTDEWILSGDIAA